MLRNLFPNTSYSFSEDDTVALAGFSIHSHHNVELLGGHGFHQVSFEIYGVNYKKSDGSFIRGRFMPVMFEDSADAITFGREHFGYPSVFSDIDIGLGSTDSMRVNLSWKGVIWATFWLQHVKETSVDELSQTDSILDEGVLVHKYVPGATDGGTTGHIHDEYDILLGASASRSETDEDSFITESKTTSLLPQRLSKSSFNAGFEILPYDENKLPTLHHIVDRLRELPVFELVEAIVKDQGGSVYPASAIRVG